MKRHKENPKPQKKGLGFPSACEKKKERKRRRRTDQTNKEREREKTTNNISDMGQVLKGTKPNSIPSPEKNTAQRNQHRSLKSRQGPKCKIPANFQRTSHGRVVGPMGRPAISGETPCGTAVPRGPSPPTTGTAPGGARTNIMPNK